MGLVAAKCTQCGANIEVDNSKEAGICNHCGTAFITEKAINNYNTYITQNIQAQNVTVQNGPTEENLLIRAKQFQSSGQYELAIQYANKVLDINVNNEEAYKIMNMKFNLFGTMCNISKLKEIESAILNYIDVLKKSNDFSRIISLRLQVMTLVNCNNEIIFNKVILMWGQGLSAVLHYMETNYTNELKAENQRHEWLRKGLCRFCGGQMGGFLTKKCKSCGQKGL